MRELRQIAVEGVRLAVRRSGPPDGPAGQRRVLLLHGAGHTGAIWAQRPLRLEGHELSDEINEKLFAIELELMDEALSKFGRASPAPQDDRAPSYYRKRTPEDSRLDPERPIVEQFDLLRVADPARFPAFFDLRGHRYVVRIEKAGAADE